MERITLTGVIVLLAGLSGLLLAVLGWAMLDFGALDYSLTMRAVVPSLVAMGVGLQLVLSGFLSGLLDLPRVKSGS
jgi:hypothetical protein